MKYDDKVLTKIMEKRIEELAVDDELTINGETYAVISESKWKIFSQAIKDSVKEYIEGLE